MSRAPTFQDWLSLARLRNIVMGACTVGVGAIVANPDPWNMESATVVLLQMISVFCFMLAGNVGNDIRDVEIDKISHPLRVLPAGIISIDQAKKFLLLGSLVSLASVLLGAYLLNNGGVDWKPMLTIWLIACALMVSYEVGPRTKEKGLIGNVIIGSMIGIVIVYGSASVGHISNPLTLSIAIMATLMGIAREIVKDVHDIEGDTDEGRTTLPMKIGAQPARNIAYLMALAGAIAIGAPFIIGWGELEEWMILFELPALLKLLRLNVPLSSGDDASAIKGLWFAMVLGLFGFLAIELVLALNI